MVAAKPWLADLYEAHFGAVFRQCLAHLEDREEAADAAHDVFAKAAGLTTPWEPGERSQAWLLTVARNHCIDLLRRRHRLAGALLRLQPDIDHVSDPEGTTLDRQLVRAVLDPLPPRDRRLLWESAVERRPLREIAAGLRLSYLATAQALRRARRRAGLIAARVAAVFGIVGLRRGASALPSMREALLVAVVPMLAISLQSSLGHSSAPSMAQSTPMPSFSVRTTTMPAAVALAVKIVRHNTSAAPAAAASETVPLISVPAAGVLVQPPIEPAAGALDAVLQASRLPARLPSAPLMVSVSPDEVALGPHGVALGR